MSREELKDQVKDFYSEAQATFGLNHENIQPCLGVVTGYKSIQISISISLFYFKLKYVCFLTLLLNFI